MSLPHDDGECPCDSPMYVTGDCALHDTTHYELVEEAMRLYETRADLCQCDDCKRTFRNYFKRKDDQYLRDIIERAT